MLDLLAKVVDFSRRVISSRFKFVWLSNIQEESKIAHILYVQESTYRTFIAGDVPGVISGMREILGELNLWTGESSLIAQGISKLFFKGASQIVLPLLNGWEMLLKSLQMLVVPVHVSVLGEWKIFLADLASRPQEADESDARFEARLLRSIVGSFYEQVFSAEGMTQQEERQWSEFVLLWGTGDMVELSKRFNHQSCARQFFPATELIRGTAVSLLH